MRRVDRGCDQATGDCAGWWPKSTLLEGCKGWSGFVLRGAWWRVGDRCGLGHRQECLCY